MTIAIHIPAGKNENFRENFNFKSFTRIAAEQPAHHFIFIFDTKPDPELYLDSNITPVVVSPSLKNSLLRHYWYNYKIPSVLERYNADVFVTADNICSLRTNIPQCMVIENFSLAGKKNSRYWKKFLPSFLAVAKAICITNVVIADDLIVNYGVKKEKVVILYPGSDESYSEIGWDQKEVVKEKYTGGKDFYLYEVNTEGMKYLITVLKAFSRFKKWQRSNMQLILLLKVPLSPQIVRDLSSYKHRNEIVLITAIEESHALLPAAYASIAINSSSVDAGIQSMSAGTPFITIENPVTRKTFEDAALFVEINEKDISDKMMLLYKNEYLRKEYIAKGIRKASPYSWSSCTSILWNTLAAISKQ